MTINRTFDEVCFNLDYYVDSFCLDVQSANPLDEINCTAQSLNGIECPQGLCPCNATRRRLLAFGTNLTTLVTYKEPVKPVISPKQTWITTIVVREVPYVPPPAPAAEGVSIALIAGVVGAVLAVVLGVGVGIGIYCATNQKKKEPLRTSIKLKI